MIEEQRKNKYKVCKIWVNKNTSFCVWVWILEKYVAAWHFENIQVAFYLLLILKSLNCSRLSKRLITTRQRRKMHPPWKTRKQEWDLYKGRRGRIGASWRKMNHQIKRWDADISTSFPKLTASEERIIREGHITEAYTMQIYLDELESTQTKTSSTLYTSVWPRSWCCKSGTSLSFNMVLDSAWFIQLSV